MKNPAIFENIIYVANPAGKDKVKKPNITGIIHNIILFVCSWRGSELLNIDTFCWANVVKATTIGSIIAKTVPIKENRNDPTKIIKYEDQSKTFRTTEETYIDKNYTGRNGDGYNFAKVRVRNLRKPVLGDKFSSRHGQKGTIGNIIPEEDMPFTDSGVKPDIIINPHAIPSRMTIGHITECIASKLAAITGIQIDATAFDHMSIDTFIEKLRACGFNRHGNEQLYSGITGEPLEAMVFMGPTYYQKLKHMVGDKIHARPRGKIVGLTRQPNEGRAQGGGLRWGEMERDVGISHGASNVLHERMLLSSDAYEAPVCNKCGMIGGMKNDFGSVVCTCMDIEKKDDGESKESTIRKVTMPYVTKLLFQELMAMGISPKIKVKDINHI